MGVLDGQVALVTGGGSGIGEEICARLAADGADVVVNGLREAEVAGVVQRVQGLGRKAIAAVGSVDDPGFVSEMVRRTEAELGPLTIAVNNAGMQEETPFLELELDTWRKQLSVDLDGPFLVASAAARVMAPRGGGVIVNITSVHEHQPRPGYAAYCVSKAGLGMLTKVLGRELAQHGIRCVAVAPGAIDTPIQGEQTAAERREQEAGIPAGRLAQPSEVAALVAYLVSPEAAYITGTTIVIDGALEQQVSLS
ncbi:MAG: glucose 1-dehydrogenase [Actinobacteria bacterium]|nr:glucose 1-dehydrogenase [Actinomycetota bacterium]MCA1720368.1 glucose 1-dehydrogenase [Actinomycetota bacterium]